MNGVPPKSVTPIGRGILAIDLKARNKMRSLFKTAYDIANRAKPFTEYEHSLALKQKNGLDLGINYLHRKAGALLPR